MSYEGQYHPLLVTASIGAPVNPVLGPITIPGLPQGFSFPLVIPGRAADGFFTKTATVDTVSMVAGAEGNVQHIFSHDESGTVNVTVNHRTLACRALSILFAAQKLIGQGQLPRFTFPVTLTDANCTPPEVHEAFNCLIMRNPDVTWGASLGTITWAFASPTIISNMSSTGF